MTCTPRFRKKSFPDFQCFWKLACSMPKNIRISLLKCSVVMVDVDHILLLSTAALLPVSWKSVSGPNQELEHFWYTFWYATNLKKLRSKMQNILGGNIVELQKHLYGWQKIRTEHATIPKLNHRDDDDDDNKKKKKSLIFLFVLRIWNL